MTAYLIIAAIAWVAVGAGRATYMLVRNRNSVILETALMVVSAVAAELPLSPSKIAFSMCRMLVLGILIGAVAGPFQGVATAFLAQRWSR